MRLRAFLAVATMALAGCSSGGPPAAAPAQTSAPELVASPTLGPASSPTQTPSVADVLRFQARTVDGATFDGTTLAGRPAVLWFWAAWCPRCRAAAPDVAAVQREFAGRVSLIGVAGLGSGEQAMRKFVADRGIGGFVNLSDDGGLVWRRFGVTTQEYYVILDRDGTVVHKGALSAANLRQRVAALAG